MNRKSAAGAAVLAVVAAQAGHLLAYQLRFGPAAQHVQSTGAHVYLPTAAKTVIGLAAAAMLGALLLVGVARLMAGRRIHRDATPSYLRVVAALFTLQLAFFVTQETCEALLSGVSTGSASDLVLWGSLGQLPAAAVAALAARWLMARLRPAIEAIGTLQAVWQLDVVPVLVTVPVTRHAVHVAACDAASSFSRRGPPSF